MKKLIISAALLFSLIIFSEEGLAKTAVPGRTKSWVNDYAGVIDARTKDYLEQFLSSIPQRTPDPVEVIIATFGDLEGWEPAEFAHAYGEKWRFIKRQRRDNGVVIILIVTDRRVFAGIGVGKNLKGIITDQMVGNIIHQTIMPLSNQGGYGEAMRRTAEMVVSTINQSEIPKDKPYILLITLITGIILILALFFRGRKTAKK